MVKRKIIHIDEEKCDGCGLCVDACHEGAIQLEDGKAKLVSEIYCDGLGDCLSECPQDAITIEEREADAFDEEAVKNRMEQLKQKPQMTGCPGSALRNFMNDSKAQSTTGAPAGDSSLGNWPIQLKLIPPGAPFLNQADLLICADCVPFAVKNFHDKYLTGKAVLVGCPKLDDLPHYLDKMKAIFTEADPKSITVLKMEVPCCTGIAQAALQAAKESVPEMQVNVITIGIKDGEEIN